MSSSVVRCVTAFTIASMCAFALVGAPMRGQAAGPTTLSIAVGIDADTLDPEGQTTTTVANMVDYMFDPLVWYNGQRTGLHGRPPYTAIEPVLATSWTVSPDGRTYTFTLRHGVKFQDGTEFDAQAVKANIDRWLDPEVRNPSRYYWDAIDPSRIETPDPDTVVLHLRRPDPTLLEKLATTAAEIVSPAAVKRLGNAKIALGPADAGTGPYMFKEWVHGDHITLVRNPNYWGRQPYFSQVVFRVVPNSGTRETMLRAGDVQMAFEPPAPDLQALRRDPSLRVVEGPSDRDIFLGLNNQYGPLKDVRVRQALNYAINKNAIIDSVLFGLGNVLESPTTAVEFGYTQLRRDGWPFSPAKAKQLLAEAGYPNGFSISLRTPTGRYIQDYQFAQAIAAQLANVGVRATVQTADWPTYISWLTAPVSRSPLQMFVLGWATQYLDADGELFGQFSSTQWPPTGLASTFYKDPQVDKLLLAGQTTVNGGQRLAIYRRAQRLIWTDAPWVFLWSQKFYVVTSSHLRGVAITPTEKWSALYATWR